MATYAVARGESNYLLMVSPSPIPFPPAKSSRLGTRRKDRAIRSAMKIISGRRRFAVAAVVFYLIAAASSVSGTGYQDALSKSILFFQGQRSGRLPADQKIKWRSDSGISDGSTENVVDLTGGYYDAGDNVKFGLPMAFTTTMLAWSVLEFGEYMNHESLPEAREAVRWGTDYLLKACTSLPDALYVQVGDPVEDHRCWVPPESTVVARPVFKVTPENPGSDVAGETAAALAAASVVFRHVDPGYSEKLLKTAKKAFAFADNYRGNYSDSLSSAVCPFYCSYSGYKDELMWGAAWLYEATNDTSYFNFAQSLALDDGCDAFTWDIKLPGARVLLARHSLDNKNEEASRFQQQAEEFMCSVLPASPSASLNYTPGGLLYKLNGSNLQAVTSTSFLLSTYAKHLKAAGATFSCGSLLVGPYRLRSLAKRQVDYILGDNPMGMSYMVGFGDKYPVRIHHRGSSIPDNLKSVECDGGFDFFFTTNDNPNCLTGAIVGGPDVEDKFQDDRANFAQSEPATYINAPFLLINI
ncbi:hypothetical protein Taro_022374 [Colocasia esculenta]|uniref:Endoglucanase n=1 Tax=Colocasia esculenta TaxID=4460 RepID=A0A843V189_COLES|nr:hypothetical protein [Colocasia esculenta]